MKKRPYRTVSVNDVPPETLEAIRRRALAERLVVGIDVAKVDFVAALMSEGEDVLLTVRWKHPVETRAFLGFLREVASTRMDAALEPTGSYGDALVSQLSEAGHGVFLVSAKKVHDATEVFDGVPSQHDAKSAGLIARLHLRGISAPWPVRSVPQRELRAAIRIMDMYRGQLQSHINELEGLLATYWPEAPNYLALDSATMLELLARFGGPQQLAQADQEARRLMRETGRCMLKPAKIEAVVASARNTIGVKAIAAEQQQLKTLAADMLRCRKSLAEAQDEVEALSIKHGATQSLAAVLGKVTAAVVVSEMGDPLEYRAPRTLVKAMGLNLKERSSGKLRGKLKITKRGSSRVRKYLYLTALRLLQDDPVVAAYYQRKIARDGSARGKAVIAVMRKLAKALWHVRRGAAFDSRKLFDCTSLDLGLAA